MSRVLIIVRTSADREKAMILCKNIAWGGRIEFKDPKRTLPQNDKMWALLTEVSDQVPWYGHKLAPTDWKTLFVDALQRHISAERRFARIVPALDCNGYVDLKMSTSGLTIDEMTRLIELIYEFGARHFVRFKDGKETL